MAIEEFKAYVYLDYPNDITKWNVARGVFCSVDIFKNHQKYRKFLSLSVASMIINDNCDRMTSESLIERIRRQYYPEKVSRLEGIFVFDEENLNTHRKNNSWGQVNHSHFFLNNSHFNEEFITEIGVSAYNKSKLDSNWIQIIMDKNDKLTPNAEDAIHNYWQGKPYPNKEPIWEYIISGYITIWDQKIRQLAVKEVYEIWPKSMYILDYSIRSLMLGVNYYLEGYIYPTLVMQNINSDETETRIEFYLNIENWNNNKFLEALNAQPSYFGMGFPYDNDKICTPDLSLASKVLSENMLNIMFSDNI